MLTRRLIRITQRAAQKGVVLVIALIVLVAMTLAAIALVRSVDTSNIIAGNLAFQESATLSSDAGVEQAIIWLENCNQGKNGCALGTLNSDSSSNGYSANGTSTTSSHNPPAGKTWDDYWNSTLKNRARMLSDDAAKNKPYFVIDRLCELAKAPMDGGNCATFQGTIPSAVSSVSSQTSINEQESGGVDLKSAAPVYYRITVRTVGPRHTVSYVQVIIAL